MNVHMGPEATISWGQVYDKNLDYNVITGIKPPNNADNTNTNLPKALGDNYTKIGSTYIYTGTLKAEQIQAGKISAQYIDTDNLSANRIYRSNTDGSGYLTLSNAGYGDLELMWDNDKWFSIYNPVGGCQLRTYEHTFLASTPDQGGVTTALGVWDFSNAMVKGVKAVFS